MELREELPGDKESVRQFHLRRSAITLPAYQPWMTGTLVYAETFWRYDLVGLRDPSA